MLNFVSKKQLEDIWNDRKCRAPLNRTRWLSEEVPSAELEAPGLYWMRGDQTSIKRNRANGKNDSK
jgi:hypothetical protein